MRSPALLPIIVAMLAVSGCGTPVQTPSLKPRAVEKQPIDLPAEQASEPQGPVDPGLLTAIAKQIEAAQAADRDFAGRRAAAEAAVAGAAGKPAGSELWIQAQEAVTTLETARSGVRDAAVAVDALRDDPANATAADRDAIDEAARRIAAIDATETDAVAGLTGRLR